MIKFVVFDSVGTAIYAAAPILTYSRLPSLPFSSSSSSSSSSIRSCSG